MTHNVQGKTGRETQLTKMEKSAAALNINESRIKKQ